MFGFSVRAATSKYPHGAGFAASLVSERSKPIEAAASKNLAIRNSPRPRIRRGGGDPCRRLEVAPTPSLLAPRAPCARNPDFHVLPTRARALADPRYPRCPRPQQRALRMVLVPANRGLLTPVAAGGRDFLRDLHNSCCVIAMGAPMGILRFTGLLHSQKTCRISDPRDRILRISIIDLDLWILQLPNPKNRERARP